MIPFLLFVQKNIIADTVPWLSASNRFMDERYIVQEELLLPCCFRSYQFAHLTQTQLLQFCAVVFSPLN